jgi:uncharacterized OB-fold protein
MAAPASKFLPRPTPETVFWWEGCRENRLLLQYCSACESHQFYPRLACCGCQSTELEWVEASGIGSVETFTICRVPVAEAYAGDLPYVVAIVRLAEGPAMMSNIIGCDVEAVSTGMPVEVVFEVRNEEITLPQFRPRPGEGGS